MVMSYQKKKKKNHDNLPSKNWVAKFLVDIPIYLKELQKTDFPRAYGIEQGVHKWFENLKTFLKRRTLFMQKMSSPRVKKMKAFSI